MKNIEDLEKKLKNKADILMVLDYNGTITPTEPKINSPFSNTIFKRVLENFARKDYIKIVAITGREISEFKEEFGLSSEEISIYGCSDNKFYDEHGASYAKKENIIDETFAKNPEYDVIYIGDDKLLIARTKELKGNTMGIPPLCKEGEELVDFSVPQSKFEDFLIMAHNLYL